MIVAARRKGRAKRRVQDGTGEDMTTAGEVERQSRDEDRTTAGEVEVQSTVRRHRRRPDNSWRGRGAVKRQTALEKT